MYSCDYRTFSRNGLMVRGAGIMMKAAAAAPDAMRADEALNAQAGFTQDDGVVEVELQSETIPLETEQTMTLRENFAETAFFYPDLRTDSTGTVRLVFTVPDALTQWKIQRTGTYPPHGLRTSAGRNPDRKTVYDSA